MNIIVTFILWYLCATGLVLSFVQASNYVSRRKDHSRRKYIVATLIVTLLLATFAILSSSPLTNFI